MELFVTATGTDVGKTYVSGLLVKKLRQWGLNCGYYKPILSGLEEKNGQLIPGDVDFVLKTANIKANPYDFVSFVYKNAVSPHLAARIEDKPVNLHKIKSDFERIKQQYDYVIVEGAGGIACPVRLDADKQILLPDIIKLLKTDIIIVSPTGLGSINSTLLTVEYAKSKGINIKGIILNNFDKKNIMHTDNKKLIEKLTGVKVIAEVKTGEQNLNVEKNTFMNILNGVDK